MEGVKWARDQPMYVLYNSLISISRTTWRWPLSSTETCTLPYVEITLYSTNKCSCVRWVHTLYISYFIEHNRDDEHHDNAMMSVRTTKCVGMTCQMLCIHRDRSWSVPDDDWDQRWMLKHWKFFYYKCVSLPEFFFLFSSPPPPSERVITLGVGCCSLFMWLIVILWTISYFYIS